MIISLGKFITCWFHFSSQRARSSQWRTWNPACLSSIAILMVNNWTKYRESNLEKWKTNQVMGPKERTCAQLNRGGGGVENVFLSMFLRYSFILWVVAMGFMGCPGVISSFASLNDEIRFYSTWAHICDYYFEDLLKGKFFLLFVFCCFFFFFGT